MGLLRLPPYYMLAGAQTALGGVPLPFDAGDPFAKYAQPGIWVDDFDYSRNADSGLARLYTTSAANVAVSATTQTIGFVLDETAEIGSAILSDDFGSYADTAAMVAAGWYCIVYNGSSDVTDNTKFALVSGSCRVTNGTGSVDFVKAVRAISCTVGKTYRVTAVETPVTATPQATLQVGTSSTGNNNTMLISGALTGTETRVGFFRATAATHYLSAGLANATDGQSFDLESVVVEEVIGNHLNQTTTGQRGTSQDVSGVKVWRPDAVDDNLLAALAPAAGTTMFLRVKPATGAKYLAGTQASSSTRFYLTCNVTTGQLGAGVGSVSETTITGGGDIRGVEGVAVLRCTGSRVSLWWYAIGGSLTQLYDDAQTGSPTTTIPFRFGALNNNGSLGSAPMDGDLYKIFVVQAAMSDADVATMAAAMAA